MYRVVLDANQIVSAFLKSTGHPAKLLDLFKEGVFEVVISPSIIEEMECVLNYPRLQKYHGRTRQEIKQFLALFKDLCINIPVENKRGIIVEDDPTDDKYVVCAIEGDADFIISGDKHLLNLGSYKNIKILTVRKFLEILKL